MRGVSAAAAALVVLVCGAASAEETIPSPELGIGCGGLLINDRGGDYTVGASRPAVDIRITVPFSPRFGFEALATISSTTSTAGLHKTDGVYILQVKQRLLSASGDRFHAFLTYGGAGYYAHFHQEPRTITRSNGTTSTITQFTYDQHDPPFFAVVGGGVQRQFGGRVGLRGDVQVVALAWAVFGVRASASFSVSVGG